MRYGFLLAVTALLLASQAARAERIQNLSMTPEEMLKQNMNVNKPGTPITGGNNLYPTAPAGGMPPLDSASAPIIGTLGAQAGGNYMDGYCDPNFKPLISRNARYASMANCLQQQRDEACRLYKTVPAEAKRVLDLSINCYARSNDVGMDDEGQIAPSMQSVGCSATDTQRLDMIKRYWTDQNTAYALVFIPDLVMDNAGTCLGRR